MSSDDPTRLRLLTACYALLTEDGVEPTMGAVASRAGVSRQAVYLHFASRADLLIAMVQYVNEEAGLPKRIAKLADAATARQALEIMVEVAVWHAFRIGPALIAANRLVESDPELKQRWSERAGRRTRLTEVVDRLRAEGSLREGLSSREALALLNTLTMPESVLALRAAGIAQHRVTTILTAGVIRMLCPD